METNNLLILYYSVKTLKNKNEKFKLNDLCRKINQFESENFKYQLKYLEPLQEGNFFLTSIALELYQICVATDKEYQKKIDEILKNLLKEL